MGTHITKALVVSIGLLFAGFSAPSALLADSIKDFECHGAAEAEMTHVYIANANISEIDGNIVSKEIEHYCELPNGQRQGLTKRTFIDYMGLTLSTYTLGQYHNDKPVGRWLIIDIKGEVIAECFYVDGSLNSNNSDPSCPG